MAAVCAVLMMAATAHADERRKVAVIDLSAEPEATQLRRALYDELQVHWALRSLGDPTLDAALEGGFVDEDDRGLTSARDALKTLAVSFAAML